MKTLTAVRYVTPLHEGGSLPAVVEADDGQLYVMKFVGAGQGPKALIAELIAGEIGRALGLHVPELVFMRLDPRVGSSEPNQEISDLLQASAGLNLGLRFLPSAFEYNPLLQPRPDRMLASAIVWFDAYITNVDRTVRNTNILVWQDEMWLIDHGAALIFHHDWRDYMERSRTPFPFSKNHVLLRWASALDEADAILRPRLADGVIPGIVRLVPDVWLEEGGPFDSPEEQRAAYTAYLLSRLDASALFVDEARHARSLLV
jgi:hypothetical protein